MVGEITEDALGRELKEKLNNGSMTAKDVESWIGRGVDISKLAAGIAAAAAGLDVNTAAQTGGNAAKNNAFACPNPALAALMSSAAFLATMSKADWKKIIDSAGGSMERLVEIVKQYTQDLQAAQKEANKLPPSTQTTVNTAPGGGADNSGAVGALPGGSTVVQTPEDWILINPGVQTLPQDYIFQQTKTVFEPKILDQLPGRGWTKDGVQNLIANPSKVYSGRDERWNSDGTKRNDPATIYADNNGNYVVRNNVEGTIVQVSNKFKPGWQKPWEKNEIVSH